MAGSDDLLRNGVLPRVERASAAVADTCVVTECRKLDWAGGVVAKLESQQVTGSFKARGAQSAVSRLPAGTRVVGASAGNHGLGLAHACRRAGLPLNICVPDNSSALKRERILRLGAGLIECGRTVDEAIDEARSLEAETESVYIPPFDDLDVIAGQATAVIELLEAAPEVDALLVPVGGGGLLAGAVAARAIVDRAVRIVGVEPSAYPSFSRSLAAGKVTRVVRRPTFADGLATNLDRDGLTLRIVQAAGDVELVCVGEEALAAAAIAMFNRESVLAEAAGVAGIAALLAEHVTSVAEHTWGTVVCGGNVHHTTFWEMACFPFSEPRLLRAVDSMGRGVEDMPVRREIVYPPRAATAPPATEHVADPDLGGVRAYVAKTDTMLRDLAALAMEDDLPLDSPAEGLVTGVNRLVEAVCDAAPAASEHEHEQRLRAARQIAASCRLAFEWRSPAYLQAGVVAGMDLGALGSVGVNYARYEQPGLAEIERMLAEALGIDRETHTVLATGSGMAGFALLLGVLRHQAALRRALIGPRIYFESLEMIEVFADDVVACDEPTDARDLAEQARACDATAVFADPLANHPEQRMLDVELLAEQLGGHADERWLVVDGTMLPLATADRVTRAMPEQALYYESCSKYLQFGLDMAMAGLVVVPRVLENVARLIRRDLGLVLDRYGCELFPRFTPDTLNARLSAMESAALRVAEGLTAADLPGWAVAFPGLVTHSDNALAVRFGRTGSCVTLHPTVGHGTRDRLEPIVNAAVARADRAGLPLAKSVSFGFTASRVSAASAMAELAPPFLRIAVGPLADAAADTLASVVAEAVGAVDGGG